MIYGHDGLRISTYVWSEADISSAGRHWVLGTWGSARTALAGLGKGHGEWPGCRLMAALWSQCTVTVGIASTALSMLGSAVAGREADWPSTSVPPNSRSRAQAQHSTAQQQRTQKGDGSAPAKGDQTSAGAAGAAGAAGVCPTAARPSDAHKRLVPDAPALSARLASHLPGSLHSGRGRRFGEEPTSGRLPAVPTGHCITDRTSARPRLHVCMAFQSRHPAACTRESRRPAP
ncbi:hypothetical protein K458DRAFT_389232 [Lentithecium fluviatile CBS 122367]|uniref:Uncharacterized protein n=1 Tax=Lentithecium fluviatile CBS 122367 TaxID=1168545 RepID=A0A6G1J0U2_9PLEO|nr:hypothetical protein K458DRAFT_389232 [Lentithecium fluviatile CBS 122367]